MTAMANNGRATAVMLLLALGLGCMLLASLFYRFSHPQLTINRMPSGVESTAVSAADAGNMGAIGRLMQEVGQNPRNENAILRLVESLMAVGEWQSAENFAQKALALESPDGQHPRALYLLALIHHNRGQHAQAAELLEKLLEKSENPSARYSLGILYIHFLNQKERGAEQLRKGLADEDAPAALREAMRGELEKLGSRSTDFSDGTAEPEYGEAGHESMPEHRTGAQSTE